MVRAFLKVVWSRLDGAGVPYVVFSFTFIIGLFIKRKRAFDQNTPGASGDSSRLNGTGVP